MRLILHTAAYWLVLKVRGAIPCMQPSVSRRILHHPLAVAEDCSADQGDCEPNQTGVRCQLP